MGRHHPPRRRWPVLLAVLAAAGLALAAPAYLADHPAPARAPAAGASCPEHTWTEPDGTVWWSCLIPEQANTPLRTQRP